MNTTRLNCGRILLLALLLVALLLVAQPVLAEPLLITQAHAHNDYVHAHPLLDALTNGFCSVEADVFLTNGELRVAHELAATVPGRTLQSLYLDPLRARVQTFGGAVYAHGPQFTLLIELKQDWSVGWPALNAVLTNYADVLSSWGPEGAKTNAIIAIITGHRDPAMFAGETVRYAALDGHLSDLDSNPPAALVPWISESWRSIFHWNGMGAIPDDELQRLQDIVRRAHQQGRRVRFWGAPDNPNFWQVMHVAGVDLINTDNLPGVRKFFADGQ